MNELEVTGITKSFGSNQVLRGVDFSLEKGKVLSVIGHSGGGKTTLLRCITGLETPDTGVIRVGGDVIFDASDKHRLSNAEKRERQLKLGLVFQQYHLFPQYSVLDNVTLACKLAARDREDYRQNKKQILSEIEENGRAILAQVGLSDKLTFYPCQLSGGQQQRVAIARALALRPKLLCFDEPTSALDPELTNEVLRVIQDLSHQNMTMLIVTHEMRFARDISSQILFMDNGLIAEQGSPEEVFDNPKSERLKAFLNANEK